MIGWNVKYMEKFISGTKYVAEVLNTKNLDKIDLMNENINLFCKNSFLEI